MLFRNVLLLRYRYKMSNRWAFRKTKEAGTQMELWKLPDLAESLEKSDKFIVPKFEKKTRLYGGPFGVYF